MTTTPTGTQHSVTSPQPTAATSNATRYLCAAAYLDPLFRIRVLDEVLFQPHRAVAPSYGIDLVPIVRHCLAAHRRALVRDGALVLILVVALLVSGPTDMVVAVVGLFATAAGVRALRYALERDFPSAVRQLVIFAALGWVMVFPLLGGSALLSSGSDFAGSAPDFGSPSLPSVLLLQVFVVLASAIVLFTERLINRQTVVEHLTPARFAKEHPPIPPKVFEERLDYIDRAQRGNVTVYSQVWTHRPVVGSGVINESWAFALPLVKTDRSPAVDESFTVEGVYNAIRAQVASLNSTRLPESSRVRHLSLHDRIFVGGLLAPDDPFLDLGSHRPAFLVEPPVVAQMMRRERGQTRHYLTARTSSWDGEVEVSCFIYAGIRGQMLYLEFVGAALPGIHPAYHSIDSAVEVSPAQIGLLAFGAVLGAFSAPLLAPVALGRTMGRSITRWWAGVRDARDMNRQLGFDYGSRTSVREIGVAWGDEVFFQQLDAKQHSMLIERSVLEAVAGAMRRHGFDTSDLDARSTVIYNEGVMISNSQVSNSAFATGKGSRASARSTARASSSAPTGGKAP